MPVRFFKEETDYTPTQKTQLKNWIKNVVEQENALPGEINYIFCSDEYLLRINKEYLDHDYYTDIITFDQSENNNTIHGDIYISIERVRANSQITSTSFEEELRRVIIHGILHLLGFDDHTKEEKKKMREKEDACLSLYKK